MPAKNQHNISIGISNSQPAALTLRRRHTDERAKKNKGFPYAIRRLYPPPYLPCKQYVVNIALHCAKGCCSMSIIAMRKKCHFHYPIIRSV